MLIETIYEIITEQIFEHIIIEQLLETIIERVFETNYNLGNSIGAAGPPPQKFVFHVFVCVCFQVFHVFCFLFEVVERF